MFGTQRRLGTRVGEKGHEDPSFLHTCSVILLSQSVKEEKKMQAEEQERANC